MNLQGWWGVFMGVAGFLQVGFGVWLLLTDRMTAQMRKGWARPRDAGMWFLCGGLFLVLLSVGYLGRLNGVFGPATGWTLMAIGLALFMLGLIKYPPRYGKSGKSWT